MKYGSIIVMEQMTYAEALPLFGLRQNVYTDPQKPMKVEPGIYPLTGTTTLLQAVALAGGLDPLAQRDGVVIFRQIEGKKMAAVFDLTRITDGTVDDPQIYGEDIIVVARSGTRSSLQELIKTAPLLTLFFLL